MTNNYWILIDGSDSWIVEMGVRNLEDPCWKWEYRMLLKTLGSTRRHLWNAEEFSTGRKTRSSGNPSNCLSIVVRI